MRKKKIELYGINTKTGCIFDIELNDMRDFSSHMLKDMVLVSGNKEYDEKIVGNIGARRFFGRIGRDFGLSVNEIESDIDILYKKLVRGRK